MRDDIAAIEARNNMLELETRNNGKLLTTLRDLLERLRLDPESAKMLEVGGLDAGRFVHVVVERHKQKPHLTHNNIGSCVYLYLASLPITLTSLCAFPRLSKQFQSCLYLADRQPFVLQSS